MTKYDVDQLTLRDLEDMARPELMRNLTRMAAFFPVPLNRRRIDGMSETDLRLFVGRARRKFQAMGY